MVEKIIYFDYKKQNNDTYILKCFPSTHRFMKNICILTFLMNKKANKKNYDEKDIHIHTYLV